jgi:hypothetical protein
MDWCVMALLLDGFVILPRVTASLALDAPVSSSVG